MSGGLTLRRATSDDAEALAHGVVEGVADYPAFAPPGWTAPAFEDELAHHRVDLGEAHYHCIVAELDGAIVGQITVVPAARAPRAVDDPALGHVRNLFVDRSQWGSGLATRLHAAVVDAARELGFAELRLFVAEGQARARRFYEREGWSLARPPAFDERIGLEIAEYRRAL